VTNRLSRFDDGSGITRDGAEATPEAAGELEIAVVERECQ
jgi:hypothetical protein